MVINMFCHIFCMSLISSTSSTDPLRPCKDPWIVIVWLIISKLNAACLAIKTVTSLLSREDFRILYLSYVHSIMTYGIIYYEHTSELVLWPLPFYRIYYIMYIWYNSIMTILHLYQWQALFPIGWLTLCGLTECIINEWMNSAQLTLNEQKSYVSSTHDTASS